MSKATWPSSDSPHQIADGDYQTWVILRGLNRRTVRGAAKLPRTIPARRARNIIIENASSTQVQRGVCVPNLREP